MGIEEKLDSLMKMVTETNSNINEMRDEINGRIDKLEKDVDSLMEDVNLLKEDVNKLKEYEIIIKGQNGHLTEQNYIVKEYLVNIIKDVIEVKNDK